MTAAEPKTIHPLVIAGIRGLFAGLRGLFAVIRAIPAADRVAFLSRQSNTPSADMLAVAAEIASRQPSVRMVMLCRNMSSHRDLGYGFHLLRQMWHVAHARTVILDKPLRSGQRFYARDSDLVVTAMVSAGAEVIADGNIHVYAPLRGRALAGAGGDKEARIFTTSMEAELISIAGLYRTFEAGVPGELLRQPATASLQVAGDDLRLAIAPLAVR